jgi:arabinose-5-phosphate isomerase
MPVSTMGARANLRKAHAYNRRILSDTRLRTVPAKPSFDAQRALLLAHQTFDIEAQALLGLKARQGESFARAVAAMLECRGRVVVMGMGKSGHVGRKIAATLASTGTPAMFVHPAEASHGDLGMVTPVDVVLAISNSGEVDELAVILPALKRVGVMLVAMTGREESTLARHADIVLSSAVDQEACPMNLAPTASTTAQMALGDALAVALLDARGFREEDFARSHPGGSLGRKLLTHVRDVMRSGDAVPRVLPDAPFLEMMSEMTRKGLGATAIADAQGHVLGIFTDGDLRRLLQQGMDLRGLTARDAMHPNPRLVREDALAVDAADMMEQFRITSVLVLDQDGLLVGALNSNDLMRAKVI